MEIQEHPYYIEDILQTAGGMDFLEQLRDKAVFLAGASGMIGTFLVDVLMYENEAFCLNCKVIACARDRQNAERRFRKYMGSRNFDLLLMDINSSVPQYDGRVDYVIQAASSTHPLEYAEKPIETIMTNVVGTDHLLRFAGMKKAKRFLLLSSVEIYGEDRSGDGVFRETDCGYIDCNTLRAGYPEAKRTAEALCQAYRKEKGTDIVILRLARTYGPTMKNDDSKALSQFVRKAAAGEDIVLKSGGSQFYSYIYMADAVGALLTVLLAGKSGEAYNAAGQNSRVSLWELARIAADSAGTAVIRENPEEREQAGYSKATRAVLNTEKLEGLGWKEKNDIFFNLRRTIIILKASKVWK